MSLPFVAENLPFASAVSDKNFICCPPFRPNFLNSKIVFYFIFLLVYCRMYEKKKGGGEGGDIDHIYINCWFPAYK